MSGHEPGSAGGDDQDLSVEPARLADGLDEPSTL